MTVAPARAAPATPVLKAVPSKLSLRHEREIQIIVPRDRCKTGKMVFVSPETAGTANPKFLECPVLLRGQTTYGSRPPVAAANISDASDTKNTQWECGTTDDGSACCYLSPNFTNGATPAPNRGYDLWLDGSRDNKVSYGNSDLSCIEFRTQTENAGNRTLLRIHSGRETKEMKARNTFGCVRIDPSCQKVFNDQLEKLTGRAPDCGTLPPNNRRATLHIKEQN